MSQADPFEGGKQAVAECWRNLTAVGATPLAVTDNLNFGNPEKPEVMGQLVRAIAGLGEACRALDFPIVSGNVSLYNETNGEAILPTPAIGGVGLIDDWRKSATLAFKAEGEAILLVGAPTQLGHASRPVALSPRDPRARGRPAPARRPRSMRSASATSSARLIRDGLVDRGPRRLGWRARGRAGRDGDGLRHRRGLVGVTGTTIPAARLLRRGPGPLSGDSQADSGHERRLWAARRGGRGLRPVGRQHGR